MRKGDDVFLLTLVDLLLQLLFLGLVLYAVNASLQSVRAAEADAQARTLARLDSIRVAQGYASIAELTDSLTRLAPVELNRLKSLSEAVEGVDSLSALVDKARRGSGKPPCVFDRIEGRDTPRPVARIVAWDDSVLVTSVGDSLTRLLAAAGAGPVPTTAIALAAFRGRFKSLIRPDCRYHAEWVERTRLVFARDTVGVVFNRLAR